MILIKNDYMPGAGLPPAVLGGREALRERIGIARLRTGRSAKSKLIGGVREVGKAALLEQMRLDAEGEGVYTRCTGDSELGALPALLSLQLRLALLRIISIESEIGSAVRKLKESAQPLRGTLTDIGIDLGGEAE